MQIKHDNQQSKIENLFTQQTLLHNAYDVYSIYIDIDDP